MAGSWPGVGTVLVVATLAITPAIARGQQTPELDPSLDTPATPSAPVEGSLTGDAPETQEPDLTAVPPPPPLDVPPPPATTQDHAAPGTVGSAPGPSADDPEADTYYEPDPVLRLEGWLRLHDERARLGRMLLGVLSLTLGAVAGAGAVWAYTLDDPGARGAVGSVLVLGAVFQITLGIAMFHVTFPQEDRLARWRAIQQQRGLTEVEVAAFAGEFFMEAEAEHFSRTVMAIVGLGMAAGGAGAIGLGLATGLTDDELLLAVTFGGSFVVFGGVLGALALLVESPIEREWRRYQEGHTPRDPDNPMTIIASPILGPNLVGAALGASF